MRFTTINRTMAYGLFLGGILIFPAVTPTVALAQAGKTEIPLPYPGYNPDRDRAMADCTQQVMPTKGISSDTIMRSNAFKFTPGIARQIQDCVAKKGYQYDSPTAARADNLSDSEKMAPKDNGGASLTDKPPPQGNVPAATVKPVPMLPMPDAEKANDESKPKTETDAVAVEEKDIKTVPGAELPVVRKRQPVFVEPESRAGSSGKPIFLKN